MIKTGIIGLGKMGLSHASIVNAHPELDLVAVCDTSSLVLEALKKYGSYKTYSDYKKMLAENELEALLVATPTKFHAEMVMEGLSRNMHVFCEKPFSLLVEQGEKMVSSATMNKVINQVGYHNRFIGTFNYLKKLVSSGVLGQVYHFTGEAYGPVVTKRKESTWRSVSTEGGGCLYDYASHVINLIEYILGDIQSAHGVMLKKIFSRDVEDAVYAGLGLANGITGQLQVNWSDDTYRKMSTQITVQGTVGKIICDAQEMKIYLKEEHAELGLEKGWNMKYITDLTAPVDFYLRGEEYSAQVDYFATCIKSRDLNNRSSFASALKTDKVIQLLKSNSL
jgi:predicted dehydrogenase